MTSWRRIRALIAVLISLYVIAAVAGGLAYYFSLRADIIEHSHINADHLTETLASYVDSVMEEYKKSARTMAGTKRVRRALESKTGQTIAEANDVTDLYRTAYGCDAAYLMDARGEVLASSNRYDADSFVGKNYSFRPYFQGAMAGRAVIYPALGVTSLRRGFYTGYPVRDQDEQAILGVVVLKISPADLETRLDVGREGGLCLVSPEGVVFMSNREDWRFGLLWELPPDKIKSMAESKQFGDKPLKWLGFKPAEGRHEAVGRDGHEYHQHRRPLKTLSGWEVIYLHDRNIIAAKLAPHLRVVAYTIAVLSAVVLLSGWVMYRWGNREINLRLVMERSLRRRESQLAEAQRIGHIGSWEYDTATRKLAWSAEMFRIFGLNPNQGVPSYDDYKKLIHPDDWERFDQAIGEAVRAGAGYQLEMRIQRADGQTRHIITRGEVQLDAGGKMSRLNGTVQDINEQVLEREARERLIAELREALNRVKTLSGLLPICASCKKIRDDRGYWHQVEAYIMDRTEAEFSHGLCPACADKMMESYRREAKKKETPQAG